MRPDRNARRLLGIASSKAKMWEFHLSERDHIQIDDDPTKLFDLAIACLGDIAAEINGEGYYPQEQNAELRTGIKFASRFFTSYYNSRLNDALNPLTILFASASFYLAEMPGSSEVLATQSRIEPMNLAAGGLEDILFWLLRNPDANFSFNKDTRYSSKISLLARIYKQFRASGDGRDKVLAAAQDLRRLAYFSGSALELLLADAVCAVIRKRLDNSVWTCLPAFSGLLVRDWRTAISKPHFMRELWPAQRLLGERGILSGKSAVVQMPTSAGKTRATELLIRSAFLSNRTSFVSVVAPFRALCHEIHQSLAKAFQGEIVAVDELSDITQEDFSIDFPKLSQRRQIIVTTPEKFHYVLRHKPELTSICGLVIYDEGHLFDDSNRGVNYELLLSSLKTKLPANSQTILISAIIKNSGQIARWLLDDEKATITGLELTPTDKSISFASWKTPLGQLHFPPLPNLQEFNYYVPRVLREMKLARNRIFPNRGKANEIALYLGLKLIANGAVAIFCGRKTSASAICRVANEILSNNFPAPPPIAFSEGAEIRKIESLVERNLGEESEIKRCAGLGIFAHHGNIPHGIRLAVEYALQQGMAKFVVCTSTLAQGVNLPIRYLIVTSVYQGSERIKVRDFHNLIGRAGRSGKHTEGSIIFADPHIFDQRDWRWGEALELLNPANSENCASAIARILSPLYNGNGKPLYAKDPLDLTRVYLDNPEEFRKIPEAISKRSSGFSIEDIRQQLEEKAIAIRSIQSYILAHSEEWENDPQSAGKLVENSLAYTLSDANGKKNLIELFELLTKNIQQKVQEASKRRIYGRTLLGLEDCLAINEWVTQNLDSMDNVSEENLFRVLWSLLRVHIKNRSFQRCNAPYLLDAVGKSWIDGRSFGWIFENHLKTARLGTGTNARRFTIDHVVELCENGLGYEGALLLGAVNEMIDFYEGEHKEVKKRLARLQKRLKYGLPSTNSVILYELGFADRIIALELGMLIDVNLFQKEQMIRVIRSNRRKFEKAINYYPSYYNRVLERILA